MTNEKKQAYKKLKDQVKQPAKDQGVTVNSDTFKKRKLKDCECFGQDPASVDNVREELQNVIDMMGPTTPHFHHNFSGDADNEDSMYSTSVYSSVVKIKTVKKNDYNDQNLTSYCEDSEMTACNISDIEQEIVTKNEVAIQTSDIIYQYPSFNMPQPMNFPVVMLPTQYDKSFQPANERRSFLSKYLGINSRRKYEKKSLELYKINIQQQERDNSPPKKLIFDLIDDMPKTNTKTVGTNTRTANIYFKPSNQYHDDMPREETPIHGNNYENTTQNTNFKKKHTSDLRHQERMDIYYFDHGNSDYYRTTDSMPIIATELLAEKTEYNTAKFWAKIFGTFHIALSFITSFLLQFIRFILHAVIRPLTVGLIQLLSDYFFKPFLAVVFNGVIQPPLIFFYNIATSFRDILKPIADSVGYFIREVAVLGKAFRFVQIDKCKTCGESQKSKCDCKRNKILM